MTSLTQTKTWAKDVVDWYEQGYSDAEVAAALRITLKDYYKQINDNAAFSQLVEYGRTLAQAFWESQVRKNLTNKQFNGPAYAFYMKNKYGWADKTETINANENINTDLDSVRTQVNAQVANFIKKHSPELTDSQRLISEIGKVANE